MLKSDAIRHFGSIKAVAEALEISRQSVHKWPAEVPELRAYQLQTMTRGKLKVKHK